MPRTSDGAIYIGLRWLYPSPSWKEAHRQRMRLTALTALESLEISPDMTATAAAATAHLRAAETLLNAYTPIATGSLRVRRLVRPLVTIERG